VAGSRASKQSVAFAMGGVLGGVLLGYLHVFVLAYMALFTYSGYKYIGPWAFYLNGTASALLTAGVLGIPLGLIYPGVGARLALLIGGVGGAFLMHFGMTSTSEMASWTPISDALQLPLLFLVGVWLGSRLRVLRGART
jgi:hypothetical protein